MQQISWHFFENVKNRPAQLHTSITKDFDESTFYSQFTVSDIDASKLLEIYITVFTNYYTIFEHSCDFKRS
jgi:hypothetical protein